MRTQVEVEGLIRRLFLEIGHDPADLIQIKYKDGTDWENALTYEVTRKDGKKTKVFRRDLDDGKEDGVKNALRAFK